MQNLLRAVVAAVLVLASVPAHALPPLPGSTASAKAADKIMGAWPIDDPWAADKEKAYANANGAKAVALFLRACREGDVLGCTELLTEDKLARWVVPDDRDLAYGRANALYKELCAAGVENDDMWACRDWLEFVDGVNEQADQRPEFVVANIRAPYAELAVGFLGECRKATKVQTAQASTCQTALELAKEHNPAIMPQIVAHICSIGYPCKKAASPAS